MFNYKMFPAVDYIRAYKWYALAAAQNHGGAQYYLGQLYVKEEGVTQDFTEALKWYEKSKTNGYEEAQEGIDRVKKLMQK